MKLIRCLNCNKVLGEVEGKAKIKCKMAGCHCMNVIDTDVDCQVIEQPNHSKEKMDAIREKIIFLAEERYPLRK